MRKTLVGLLFCVPMAVWGYFAYDNYHDIETNVETPIKKAVEADDLRVSLHQLKKAKKYLEKKNLTRMNNGKLYRNIKESIKIYTRINNNEATPDYVTLGVKLVRAKLMEDGKVKNTTDTMFGNYHKLLTALSILFGILALLGIVIMGAVIIPAVWDWAED